MRIEAYFFYTSFAIEMSWKCPGSAMEVSWKCRGSAVEVLLKCSWSASSPAIGPKGFSENLHDRSKFLSVRSYTGIASLFAIIGHLYQFEGHSQVVVFQNWLVVVHQGQLRAWPNGGYPVVMELLHMMLMLIMIMIMMVNVNENYYPHYDDEREL